MEFLESQDPEKKKLIEASERHKRALEKGVTDLSNNTQKMLTNALIIGGVMAVSYLVVRGLSKGGGKKKHKKKAKVTVVQPSVSRQDEEEEEDDSGSPSLLADIGTRLANQATMVLIDLARQKLMDYLESRKKEE
jgi:hypothetical protein